MQSVDTIIGLWPSVSEFARDLGLKRATHGGVMKLRHSIPVSYWPRLIDAAKSRGFALTYEDLTLAHSSREPFPHGEAAR